MEPRRIPGQIIPRSAVWVYMVPVLLLDLTSLGLRIAELHMDLSTTMLVGVLVSILVFLSHVVLVPLSPLGDRRHFLWLSTTRRLNLAAVGVTAILHAGLTVWVTAHTDGLRDQEVREMLGVLELVQQFLTAISMALLVLAGAMVLAFFRCLGRCVHKDDLHYFRAETTVESEDSPYEL